MKKIIQLFLSLILLIILISFYLFYFKTDKKEVSEVLIEEKNQSVENTNNLIKNLRYNVNFDDNTQYMITSDLSELTYENDMEIVKMQKVKAILTDENNLKLFITSNNAIYNNSNYSTNFSNNIKIEYVDNIIYAEKLDLNFDENIVEIYDNVVYQGLKGEIKADKITINLITKSVAINMKNFDKKVEVTTY